MKRWSCAAALSVALVPIVAWCQEEVLTLEGALGRARRQAVAIASARARIDEARARLGGARALRDNLVLEGAYGQRTVDGIPADLELGLGQTFELGGRRGSRITAAESALTKETANADEATRLALREVASAFLRGLAAAERVRLARTGEGYASEVHRVAERRHAVGEVAALDLNLAAGALARARSEARAALAAQVLALGELKAMLGYEPEAALRLAGELAPRAAPELASLLEAAAARPDLRAAEAELREAEAEIGFGKGLRWPDVTPSLRYERDEGQTVLWGGVSLSLPLWNRGREARGVAEARAARLRAELLAQRRAARNQVASAFEAHRERLAALDELARAAAQFEDNEALARRSYEVGQVGLGELLLVRRETVEARLLQLERRLEAADSEIELLSRAGVLR